MKLDADTFVAAIADEVINEACRLDTLADCTPEEFELRTIRLPDNKLVNIGFADGAQLGLLCRQLLNAGVPAAAG